MKKILGSSASVILVLLSTIALAQRPRLTYGNLDVIRNIRAMNVRYDYSNMDVGKKTEQEYVSEKRESLNDKSSGRGDKWAESWVADRQRRFEPQFEEQFNHNSGIQIRPGNNEQYTMIFKTIFTEPGYNVGVVRGNSYIDAEVWIVETANQNNVVAKILINNCPGRNFMGTDFDTGERIQEAYAMAGKALARFMERAMRY